MACLIRWKTKKLIERANQQISEAQSLFNTRQDEIDPRYHTVINDRLVHVEEFREELRRGLDGRPRWEHIEGSRQYYEEAGEVLHEVKGMLVPDPDEGQPSQQSN